MKIKYLSIAAAIMALSLTACTKDSFDDQTPGSGSTEIKTEIPEDCIPMKINFSADASGTRTSVQNYAFTFWEQGDAIGVFSPQAYYEATYSFNTSLFNYNTPGSNICFDAKSGFGTPSATFGASHIYDDEVIIYTGNWGWNTKYDTMDFYAYYPYADAAKANTKYTAVPFTLPSVQTQSAAGKTDHLGALDFLYASSSIVRPADIEDKTAVEGDVLFAFDHAFSLLKMTVQNSTSDTLTINGIKITTEDAPLAGSCVIDLSTGAISTGKAIDGSGNVIAAGRSFNAQIGLTEKPRIAKSGTAVLNMMVFPGDYSTTGLTITVETSGGIQTFTSKKVLEAAKTYTKTLSLTTAGLQPAPTYDLQVVDFEDADEGYLAADKSGSNYYDSSYFGYMDEATGLFFSVNPGSSEDYKMWNGGLFISQFNDMQTAGSGNQCSVYYSDESTGFGGHRGSQTFCLSYGYQDEFSYSDGRPSLYFEDEDKEAVFDHVWVTNATYTAISMQTGDQFAKKFSYENKDWMKITATGFKADGSQSSTVELYLADFRTETSGGIVTEWTKLDLSSLGSVNKIVFNVESSDVGDWGMNTPAYFCMDDLAIRIDK